MTPAGQLDARGDPVSKPRRGSVDAPAEGLDALADAAQGARAAAAALRWLAACAVAFAGLLLLSLLLAMFERGGAAEPAAIPSSACLDYDLAVLAFVNEYRSIDTPAVRFVWSYALLRLVQARKRGFDRPVSAYETVKISLAGGPDHLAALEKSIKAVAVCNVCGGEGRFRCTNCHGKKETKFFCQRCKGSGHTISSLGARLVCPACLGKGIEKIVKCEKCKNGYVDCRQCDKPRPAPSMEDIVGATVCVVCEGRGMAFRNAAVPCRACLGLGARLIPKADPSKILP